MNIPSGPTAPTPPAAPPAAAAGGDSPTKGASGQLDGQMVQLVASGQHTDESQWQIGELNRNLLADPSHPREAPTRMNKTTSLEGRLKLALSNLDAHHNRSSFAGKIRSLARAIMSLFTHTRTDSADRPAARSSPYEAVAARIDAGGSNLSDAARINLNLLTEFHQASRKIPEIERQIAASDRSELAGNLTQLTGPTDRLLSTAAALQHLQGDSVRSVLDSDPDFKKLPGADSYAADLKREKLKLNVESATRQLAAILDEPYTPRNPQLRQLAESLPEGSLRLSQLASPDGSPYGRLSESPHFGEKEDQHLRTWMSQALAMVGKCAQTIDAAMLENSTDLHISDADMNNLRQLGSRGKESAV